MLFLAATKRGGVKVRGLRLLSLSVNWWMDAIFSCHKERWCQGQAGQRGLTCLEVAV